MSETARRRTREPDRAASYEAHQEWPPETAAAVARHLRESAGRSSIFLGCATGVNDALPFARLAGPGERVTATDVDPSYLETLGERVRSEGLAHVDVRKLDITSDLEGAGPYDLAALFFVIHRIPGWPRVVANLARLLAPGGSFFTSEFAGLSGVIYLSNENGGWGRDPVSRLIRRYFELLPERFAPPLKSTFVRPFLDALAGELAPAGFRDFAWPQSLSVGDMVDRIECGAYAPYFSVRPPMRVLDRVRAEFASEWSARSDFVETIRIYRFVRAR